LILAPLTPDQAMRALLEVKPSDVAKLDAQERGKKKPTRVRQRPAARTKREVTWRIDWTTQDRR
jgi:hypothetical protein